jgi:hypothetical protein
MLGSAQVSSILNTHIKCTGFQRLCTGLSKCHGLGMLGLRYFCWSMGMLWGV